MIPSSNPTTSPSVDTSVTPSVIHSSMTSKVPSNQCSSVLRVHPIETLINEPSNLPSLEQSKETSEGPNPDS